MEKEVILEVEGIEKSFPGVKALKGVGLTVRKGEVHALCGENGAGKTTLMHILAGGYRPDSGKVLLEGREVKMENQRHANELGISIVYQERSLISQLSVAENIYAARQPVNLIGQIDWNNLYKTTGEHLKSLNIHIDPRTLVGNLTPPMQQMVEIAKALSIEPKILILDEPTATITEKEKESLFKMIRKLKDKGISMIYISHRMAEIFEIADRVSVLKDGMYMGTEEVRNIDQNWIIKKMVGRDIYFERVNRDTSDEIVFECKNFCDSKRFKNIDFNLKRGEILSFAGLAGAGRTEVFRTVFGADLKTSGTVFLEGKTLKIKNCIDAIKAGIGYLPEDRKEQGLFLDMAVCHNVASASLMKFKHGLEISDKKIMQVAEEYRKKLAIATPNVKQKVVNLSGGNQQKVVLAKWLLVNPKILIVDEPTRGVDVGVKLEIYSILRKLTENGTSIIVISSDLPEVLSISDRIYVMCGGEITGEIQGNEATEEIIMKWASGINATHNAERSES